MLSQDILAKLERGVTSSSVESYIIYGNLHITKKKKKKIASVNVLYFYIT